MIRWVRTTTANAGKFSSLVQWGKELTEHLNSTHGTNITMFKEQFGRQRVHWSMDVKSLAELESILMKVQGDADYLKRAATIEGLVLSGSTHDTVVQSVS